MCRQSKIFTFIALNVLGLISALSPPYCPNVETCGEGTSWDIFKCECVKIPCGTVQCPENYKPDPKDKCKCKCTDEPTTFCGRGRGWDRTQCQCVSMCDFIKQCPKGQKWSLRSCQCQPICKNKCPKNFVPDPDNKCACTCSLPAEICTPSSFFWDRKSCKCVKKPPCADVTCPSNYSPDPKDKCKCKCKEAPDVPCQMSDGGARWARNQCRCEFFNDIMEICPNPETQDWSLLTSKCVPKTCNNICPKNASPVPDFFCDCHSNLPAEVCAAGFKWDHKVGKCVKTCQPKADRKCPENEYYNSEQCKCIKLCFLITETKCTGGNEYSSDHNCACKCIRPKQSCKEGFTWDTEECQCIVDEYYNYDDEYYNYEE